jgi:histidinol-phosphate/aromatic aminotransferase/cobyric acid decarboxylase-like protein/choline kinase
MKALILAAGFGNRMRPLTDHIHKTLLKVNGQAIIDRIVSGLVENGITRIVVVTGYRAEELTDHLRDRFSGVSFEFVHNARYRETNNIYSMALAFEQIALDDDLLLIESDLIFAPEVIERAIKSRHENVALVSPYVTGMDGTVVQVTGGKITSIYPPHLQSGKFDLFDKYKTLNVYRFSRDFCANEFKKLLVYYAKVIDDNCYYELILGILIYMQREDIYCEIIDNDKWAEVDDPNDLMGAEYSFNKEDRLSILEESFGGFWNYDVLDFAFIRNMHFPSESMFSEVRNNLPYLLTNYGSKQSLLNRKLSYVLQCTEDRLLVLNGACQVYPILPLLLAGKRVLLPEPTFGEYQRVFVASETYGDTVGVDQAEVESKLAVCDVGVFVNPNNPTGSTVPTDWLVALAERNPEKLLIVDESFVEFSDQLSIMRHLESSPRNNVLVITSMSKSYGVPGMRLGYVYTCDHELLRRIGQQIPIWNINSVAEFFLEILLKNKLALARSFALTAGDRSEFAAALKTLDTFDCVFPSGADFLLVRAAGDRDRTRSLVRHLLVHDSIYIKEVTRKMGDAGKRYYRLAVRLPEENGRLVAAIRRFEAANNSEAGGARTDA